MKKLKAWIAAARLRTLPLSVSGIIVGASLALDQFYNSVLFWLAIAATLGFQVLSNFANDYGDGIRGTDTKREGEKRMVASGFITPKEMKVGMLVMGVITFFIASILIFMAFGYDSLFTAFIFFNLTLLALLAAVRYTVGKKAYGYSGWGDVFVFLFFGFLSVLGSYYLFTQNVTWLEILPALSIGCFSTAVLNLNNLRDIHNDAAVGKRTLVVKMGFEKGKRYHAFLLIFGMIAAIGYSLISERTGWHWLYVIAFVPMLLNVRTVFKNQEPRKLDGELKKIALSTFLFALLFSLF
ncbi:MAG: 1,4-dihydroxy-2-naphthoate octaprenyltransferase [Alteromonas sp.]|nr:1,4-dihydroxy-2-naphthoate octaprenyltransferase [Alteromonas sp.]MAY22948.1 1,4-dihydroxy-2-naphthoate octaprenyltransferase [Flavobacteriaceae bacterium]|tara:strand:- start:37857 stop:38744 length:888 start_codon:yes stop_codon:yes gene_type:complete